MKSFKEFILKEEANEKLIKALEELKYNEEGEYNWPEELSDKDMDALESASSVEDFDTKKKEIIENLKSNKEEDNSNNNNEEKDLETDINGLKDLFNKYQLAGKLDEIIKYINSLPKGNNKPQLFEKIVNAVNINCAEKVKTARDAKNAIIFYILFRALNRKVADKYTELKQQGGSLTIFNGDVIGGGSLFKSFKNFKNEDVKTFLDTSFNFSSNFSNIIGVNANGSGNGSLLKLIEKCSKLDIDEEGLKTIEKEIDGFKSEPLQGSPALKAEPLQGGPALKAGKTEGTNETKADEAGKTEGTNETKADEAGKTKGTNETKADETQSDLKSKNDVKTNSEENDNKTNSKENYKLFRLNSKSSPEEINDAVEEFFGTGDKGKLEHFLIKVEMQKSENDAIGQERKNYNLKNLEKYKRDHEDVEDNGNNVSENYVLNTLYNNPLINEGFKNFVRNVRSSLPTIGRINIGNSKTSEKSWNNCISKMKEAQAEYEKKAITISGKATNPNCSIPQKHSLLTKLKTLAGEYNVHLNGIFEQYRKRNGYNAIGSALHDIKSDLYKHQINKFEDSKETNAYREKLMSKESVKKAISNLSTENLDKITSVGGIGNKYLFAYAVLNIAKNDRDSLLARDIINGKGNVEKGLRNILDNNYETFGVNKDTNLYTFSDLLFNSSKDIQNWLEENSKQYEKRLRTHPLFDELKLLQSYGKTWLERVSQQNRSGADFKKEFEINESVSSISFKEFYVLYEDGQPNPEPLCKNDKEKSILATLFLINNSSSDAVKEAAAKYLATKNEDKIGYTANDYLTAAKSYREDNANNNKYIELCNFFNKLLVSPGANNQASQNQNQGQGQGQNQNQNQNQGQIQNQKQIPKSGNTIGDAYLQSKGINNQQDFENAMDELGNYSVVTSDAVGESKIPDRLYRKIIRKKINSFV